jgi:hypothetical protein
MEAKRIAEEERMLAEPVKRGRWGLKKRLISFLKGNERGQKARVSLVHITAAKNEDVMPTRIRHVTVPTACLICYFR